VLVTGATGAKYAPPPPEIAATIVFPLSPRAAEALRAPVSPAQVGN
jgi:hypothetical protein